MDAPLDTAESWLAARGEKLTELRREVLSLLLASHGPVKAYDLLAALQKQRPGASPPTVYRTLDFLVAAGIVHRIDSLQAFVVCPSFHDAHHGVLLVCERCHGVEEIDNPPWMETLRSALATGGFAMSRHELEIKGLCRNCQEIAA
ncbi:Fur family transcriptional regulator, zinc uptake regulator [Andreprevotia lacus DSM 23236]|jgi:Fur family zinc uptake transcriptional regulator|uniref:Ferric uptake regulation protein n=1 Tax=Andreprevotia lacus DSM 23236 TaxID=1121001 RepID=A0A1W1Y0H9_9NEIS|nr:Fur family transcriptional regulator [Andreprevotia lacus]SMC29635.1 Fur family transcriptional regulator, zinc uptake regulator [Andreprevotia lacus DSM 23236]